RVSIRSDTSGGVAIGIQHSASASAVRRIIRCTPRFYSRLRAAAPLRRAAWRERITTLCMPFKSQAQRRKFAELLVQGKISPQTFEEWNRETGAKKLPEHVKHRSARRRKPTVK